MIEAEKFPRRGTGDNTAGFEQDDAGGQEQGLAQIVGDKDDGFAESAGKGPEFLLKFGAGDGIERTERFVHQQDRRIGGEGAGNADPLALASGELARATFGVFARIKTHQPEHFLDSGCRARRVPVFQTGYEGHILCNGEMGEQAGVLDDVTNAPTKANGIPLGSDAILHEDFPFRWK